LNIIRRFSNAFSKKISTISKYDITEDRLRDAIDEISHFNRRVFLAGGGSTLHVGAGGSRFIFKLKMVY
jgi:D-arabinose 5-phosphate isomerase GutQ